MRDAQNVYDEFSQYVDGSLVLAPIIYVNLSNRNHNESYNDFLLRLFENGIFINLELSKPLIMML